MCNQFAFHHQFRIDIGKTKFEQKTVSILTVYGKNHVDKEHKDPEKIALNAQCLVW